MLCAQTISHPRFQAVYALVHRVGLGVVVGQGAGDGDNTREGKARRADVLQMVGMMTTIQKWEKVSIV